MVKTARDLRYLTVAVAMLLAVATGCSSSDGDDEADGASEVTTAESAATTAAAAAGAAEDAAASGTATTAPAVTAAAETTVPPPSTETSAAPAAAAEAAAGGGDVCLVGSWEATAAEAQRWAGAYATNLVAADPVANGATVTIDSAAFTSTFRADGTGTNTSVIAGTATHPLGTGAATLRSTSQFEWRVEGGQLVFTYLGGTADNEVTIGGLTVPFAGSAPTSGSTNAVAYTCSDATLQADFGFDPLGTATPQLQRVG